MQQVHFIQQLYNKFFPQNFAKGLKLSKIPKSLEDLPIDEKKKLASELLTKAEMLLIKEDLSALKLFNEAAQLDPSNPLVWYRQGLAFFEYGTFENREKALLLASKHFKIATSLDSNVFDYWWAWGNVLFVLGNNNDSYNYFLEAKKKYKLAIKLSQNQSNDTLAELHWDYGLICTFIADYSGEAIDLKSAIESFHTFLSYQEQDIPAAFWFDFGQAYLKMGLLINDNNIYIQAIDYFKKATEKSKKYVSAFSSIAHAYTQLYINTLDEKHFNQADHYFMQALEINPLDADLWLEWAQLLDEGGKINKDPKKLRASIEKCIRAYRRKKTDPLIIGQWAESLAMLGAYTNRLDLIVEAENKIMKTTDIYSDDSDLWYSYGICMNAFGIYYNDPDYDDYAIEKFQIGLSLDRTNPELWHAIASSHAKIGKTTENIDLLERANKFYQKAIDLKPSCPALIFDYAKTLSELGEFSANQVVLEESIKQFEIALNLQRNALLQHPEWIFHYASSLDLLGDCVEEASYYHKAIEIFNNVLLVDPDYPLIYYRLAVCFSHLLELEAKKEYLDKAINYFKLAVKQDSEDQNLFLEWGLMLISFAYDNLSFDVQKQYYCDAEQKIIKSGQLGNQHAYYHLACLYSLQERFEESFDLLEKAKKLDILPPLEEMLEDEWLEPIRSTDLFSHFLFQLEKKEN